MVEHIEDGAGGGEHGLPLASLVQSEEEHLASLEAFGVEDVTVGRSGGVDDLTQ